ncbi:Hypothetical predicted protein, partial [Marmota monax]
PTAPPNSKKQPDLTNDSPLPKKTKMEECCERYKRQTYPREKTPTWCLRTSSYLLLFCSSAKSSHPCELSHQRQIQISL